MYYESIESSKGMQYVLTVKILLNAHALINAHTPIWMPKMDILSESFGIPGTSNTTNAHIKNVEKNPIF